MQNKVKIELNDYLNLINDGAIANTKTADGKLIPLLIVDTSVNKNLTHLVNMHEGNNIGDVTSLWAYKRFDHRYVSLVLFFERPVEMKLAISFEVLRHAPLIEGILISKALYLQPGKPGDKIGDDFSAPKILVEIPERTTFDIWESILNKAIKKKLKKEGVQRKNLKKAADEHNALIKGIWGKRLK
ncbi:TPA: hypothetical protein NPP35_001625 [Klebsiella variicola subsp. variicola]|nr:hypothetical protein [Klebsiella variicola subsp. variicola]